MVDARFVTLRETLLKAGVAAHHARRACLEIQCHYEQMIDAALARGASLHEARLEAHALLST